MRNSSVSNFVQEPTVTGFMLIELAQIANRYPSDLFAKCPEYVKYAAWIVMDREGELVDHESGLLPHLPHPGNVRDYLEQRVRSDLNSAYSEPHVIEAATRLGLDMAVVAKS